MSFVDKHAILIFLFLNENYSVPPEAEIFPFSAVPSVAIGPSQDPNQQGPGFYHWGHNGRCVVKLRVQGTIPVSLSMPWCLMKYWDFTFVPLKAQLLQ